VTDQTGDRAADRRDSTCGRVIARAGSPARPFDAPRWRLIELRRSLDETFGEPGPPLALADSAVSFGPGRDA